MKINNRQRSTSFAASAFIALAAFGLTANTAQAAITVIASDDFESALYPIGDYLGVGTGNPHRGGTGFFNSGRTGLNPWVHRNDRRNRNGEQFVEVIGDAGNKLVQINGPVEISRNSVHPINSLGEFWISFDFQNLSGTSGDAGFALFNGTAIGDAELLSIGTHNGGTTWSLRAGNNNGTISDSEIDALGSMQTGVVRLTVGAGTTGKAELWVGATGSPVDVSGAALATLTGLGNLQNVVDYRLRSTGSDALLDNIVIYSIPEPSSVAFLGLCGAFAFMRRRR